MTCAGRKLRLLLAREWDWPGTDIEKLLKRSSNYDVVSVQREEHDWSSLSVTSFDVVLTYGPHYGTMLPMLRAIRCARSVNRSVKFVWWLSENPPGSITRPDVRMVGKTRLLADRLHHRLLSPVDFRSRAVQVGHRYRISELLHWAAVNEVVDAVGVTAAFRQPLLQAAGLESVFAPYGAGDDSALGRYLGGVRDIDVLWLGRLDKGRRPVLVSQAMQILEREGVRTAVIASGLGGEERTALLNRSRIMLNFLRAPSDWTGMRLLLGAVNGALNVSETLWDSAPFVDGVHLAVAEPSAVAHRALELLGTPDEINRLTGNALHLVCTEHSLKRGLSRLLASAGLEDIRLS